MSAAHQVRDARELLTQLLTRMEHESVRLDVWIAETKSVIQILTHDPENHT